MTESDSATDRQSTSTTATGSGKPLSRSAGNGREQRRPVAGQHRGRGGREHLPGRGRVAQPRGFDDRGAEHVAVLGRDLPGGHADPHGEAVAVAVLRPTDRVLDRDAGGQRIGRRLEPRHRAVAERLHDEPPVADDGTDHEGVEPAAPALELGIAEVDPQLRRSDEIAEQHRRELDRHASQRSQI